MERDFAPSVQKIVQTLMYIITLLYMYLLIEEYEKYEVWTMEFCIIDVQNQNLFVAVPNIFVFLTWVVS